MRLAALLLALLPLPAAAHDFAAGGLHVEHPFTLATPARAVAGYLSVTNGGDASDALLGVEVEGAAATLHRTEVGDDGIARMVPADRLEVPAGGTLVLSPGGAHVMIEGLAEAPEVGARLPATLLFERAGPLAVEFVVEPMSFVASPEVAGEAMDHGAMGH